MPTGHIQLNNVSLSRGGQPILQDISLQLSEPRVGIIGYNGSGKSSLLRLLCGLLKPDSGDIQVYGKDSRSGVKPLCQRAGLIFQNPDHQLIFPTVIEELSFGLQNLGFSKAQAIAKSDALLAHYNRAAWRDRPVASFSEGQKQLLCIFSILLMQPHALLFDEPYASLDLPTRYQLADVIGALSQQVIMVSHEPESFQGFDRVIWIDQGTIKDDGSPSEVLPRYRQQALSIDSL